VFAAQPLKALHLFAYTGATTLALAAMGMHVTHVDAMESAVGWARENARLSAMQECPIRWIVDDARAYVARELRRGNQYDLILLDPPSYGHGSRGQAWEIHRDLLPLLQDAWSLLSSRAIGVVLTGHSPDVDVRSIHRGLVESVEGPDRVRLEASQAVLTDTSGRGMDCGYVARFLRHRVEER
jgi:23S rRNA (cytosine1962-C5)-methyltransferase